MSALKYGLRVRFPALNLLPFIALPTQLAVEQNLKSTLFSHLVSWQNQSSSLRLTVQAGYNPQVRIVQDGGSINATLSMDASDERFPSMYQQGYIF